VVVILSRDPWPFSTVMVDNLDALVADGLLRPLSGASSARGKDGAEASSGANLGGTRGDRGSRGLPAGTIGRGPEWVSILGYLRPSSSFVCPDPALPFLPSKRRHGSIGMAPRKVLKTASASAASAAPGLAGLLTRCPKAGAQAAQVAVGRAPEAGPSVEAAVVPRETVGAAAASSPPYVLPALAPASAEAVAVLAVEPPVAADAEMAEASLLDASEEGCAEPQPVLGSGNLVPARRSPDGRRQSLRFWTRGASDPLFVSVPRRRWGRSGRPWRSFAGTFPRSSR
jgi:hypothetical protein